MAAERSAPIQINNLRQLVSNSGAHSQRLLGHKNREMTERYVRQRIGQQVKPTR